MTPNQPTPIRPTRQATAREFFEVIFRRKWLIAGLFLATTLTVLVVALSTPVTFSSSGRVLVKRGEQMSAISPGRQLFGDWENDLASELEVARSVPVLSKVREILDEETKQGQPPVKLDPGAVDAEVMGKSNVLGLAYTDLDPAVARRVCNALIQSYIAFRRDQVELRRPEAFFRKELAQVQSTIDAKLAQRERLSAQSGVIDASGQPQQVLAQLGMFLREQSLAEADLAEAVAGQRAMQVLSEDPEIDLPTLGQQYSSESALVDLKKRMVDQEARIASLRERYRDDSPEITMAQETLEHFAACSSAKWTPGCASRPRGSECCRPAWRWSIAGLPNSRSRSAHCPRRRCPSSSSTPRCARCASAIASWPWRATRRASPRTPRPA